MVTHFVENKTLRTMLPNNDDFFLFCFLGSRQNMQSAKRFKSQAVQKIASSLRKK